MMFFSKLKTFSLTQHREKFNKHIFENERDCNDKVDNTFFEREIAKRKISTFSENCMKSTWKFHFEIFRFWKSRINKFLKTSKLF